MRTGQPVVTRAYLAVGITVIAAGPLLPRPAHEPVFLLFGAVVAAAVVVGIRRNQPARRLPWRLVLGGLCVALTYTVVSAIQTANGGDARYPDYTDWFYLAMYPLLIVALSMMPWGTRYAARSTGMVDAAIITCTAGVLSWTLLVDDFLEIQRMAPDALAVCLAYPLFDLLLAGTVTRMAVFGGWRNPAQVLIMVAAGCFLAADTAYFIGMTPTGPGRASPVSVTGWLLAYLCLSAAALHPAMGKGTSPAGAHRVAGRGRMLRYALLVLVGPAATGVNLLLDRGDGPLGAVDVLLPLALTAATGVLLVVRSGQLAAVAQRRASDLDIRTAELEAALGSQAALQEQLAHRALHDALTGLPNRVLLRERLDHAMTRPGPHALLLLDLDGFKDVNDTLGHPVGDELLTVAAQRLGRVLSRIDTLARLGGDEFAILLEDISPEQANAVAVRVLTAVREPFAVAGHRLHVTASVGLLELTAGAGDDAFRDADLALYAAKAAGKDCVVRYHEGLREEHLHRTRLVERLRQALEHGELDLHYQPVVDLRTGSVVAAEALLRWFPAGEEQIRPDQFIPVAESSGLILPIGGWVLRRACDQAREWYAAHGVRISVNVSAEQLRDPNFPREVEAALADAGLPAAALVIEVTESMLVDPTNGDAQRAVAHLTHLRSLGVQVALDDFGTGYSSLAYLRDLPVDFLKIDRAFVPRADSPQRGQLTRAIVDLGASLGLTTVAEGVETAEQAVQLTALDCDLAQGYHFFRPLPANEVSAMLHTRIRPLAAA
jgi:diguanylate cyclase (GGDEF)-like protein